MYFKYNIYIIHIIDIVHLYIYIYDDWEGDGSILAGYAKSVSWPYLFQLRRWDSLIMAVPGEFMLYIYNKNLYIIYKN